MTTFNRNTYTIDFETMPIERRPHYPPEPVGVAIRFPGGKKKYYAWGHSAQNNCTKEDAQQVLQDIDLEVQRREAQVLFWHAKFDLAVGQERLDVFHDLPWEGVHDAMFLAFLDDPHARKVGLKPTAERLLDMPSEERDRMAEWLVEKQPVAGEKITMARAAKWTAYAPGKLAGRYAKGDVDRTWRVNKALFKLTTVERGMAEPYDRERRLLPVLMESERAGVRVHVEHLAKDVAAYTAWFQVVEEWIRKRLGANEDLNINAGAQLVQAMLSAGVVEESDLGRTKPTKTFPEGKVRTSREAIAGAVTDPTLISALAYRGQLKTYLGTFMTPWLAMANASDGRIFSSWASTRADETGTAGGARTGRLSSSPNFQNIPQRWDPHWRTKDPDTKGLPKCPIRGLPDLPRVRSYVAPWRPGHVLIQRDFNQQELRILAHFEFGDLLDAYKNNPWLDVHTMAQQTINAMLGTSWDRGQVKGTGFGLIYGMGLGALAKSIGGSVGDAKALKDGYLARFSGIKDMFRDMKDRATAGRPIRTIGGRVYFCEPPTFVEGRWRKFDYKMVNLLIQGSAADITKEAMIQYNEMKADNEVFLLTVHDEILASVPARQRRTGMHRLRTAMEGVGMIEVELKTDGKSSDDSWTALKTFDSMGVEV